MRLTLDSEVDMKELQVTVKVRKDQVVTDSLTVAKDFGKLPKNILRDIDAIKDQIDTAQFRAMYYETDYKADNGQTKVNRPISY